MLGFQFVEIIALVLMELINIYKEQLKELRIIIGAFQFGYIRKQQMDFIFLLGIFMEQIKFYHYTLIQVINIM